MESNSNQIQEEDKRDYHHPDDLITAKHQFEFEGHQFVVDEKYQPDRFIGYDSRGPMCQVINKITNRRLIIRKAENIFENRVHARDWVREICILRFFDHENILPIVDLIQPDTKTDYKDIYIVTEPFTTDLLRVIMSRQELSNEYLQYFLYQILRGLLYIHSAGLIHRNLKPSILLINSSSDLKISDFQFSKPPPKEILFDTEYISNRPYKAPETLLGQLETQAVDIWAVGCIFGELLGRTILFPGTDSLDQLNRILAIIGTPEEEDMGFMKTKGALDHMKKLPQREKRAWEELFPNADPQALHLLDKMLTFDPEKRYTIQECLAHPYLEELHDPKDDPICKERFTWPGDEIDKPSVEFLQALIYDESINIRSKK